MSFDPATIICVLTFGAVGFVYAYYGKKMEKYSFLLAGILLNIYYYAIEGVFWLVVIGLILSLSPFIMRKYF